MASMRVVVAAICGAVAAVPIRSRPLSPATPSLATSMLFEPLVTL
jgi:hypothetical protein